MNSTILLILPVLLIFLLGVLLKKTKVLKKDDGDLLLKLIYYVGAPCLIFNALVTVKLSLDLLIFPLVAVILVVISFFTANIANRFLKLKKTTRGVFIISSMIINSGFTLPFIISGYGTEGVIRYAFFDLANATLTFTWIYLIACKHNPAGYNNKLMVRKLLTSPPVWAIFIGIIVKVNGIILPDFLLSFTKSISTIVGPLIMIALGLYFEPRIIKLPPTITAISIRMILGMILGLSIVSIFNLTGINKQIIILLASSPIGFNTITFASIENLDKEFAASIVSAGLIIGIFLIPLLMLIIGV